MFRFLKSREKSTPAGPTVRRYFGPDGTFLRGAVHCPQSPGLPLTVALLDHSGEIVCTAPANGPCSRGALPPDCGFAIPMPLAWLLHPEPEIRYSFRVLETGVEFPKGGDVLQRQKLLKMTRLARSGKPLPPDGASELEQALAAVPAGKKPFVIAVHELQRSGAPLIALSLARNLTATTGWHPVTLCLGPTGPLADDFAALGQLVCGLGAALQQDPDTTVEMLGRLREFSQPAALVNSLCTAPLAAALKQAGFQVISLVHEYPFAFTPRLTESLLMASEEVIFPCEDVHLQFAAHLAGHPCRSRVMPQGAYMIEERHGKNLPAADGAILRDRLGIAPEEHVVLACGTVDARKGFDWFVSFVLHFGRLSTLGGRTHFVWLGKISDRELFFHGVHSLEANGLSGRFHHVKEMMDPFEAYAAADLLMMCSRIDPFPSVVLEAISAGLPVVGFDRGQGVAPLIRETGFGAVVRSLDMEEARLAIEHLLSNHELREKTASEGLELVSNRFRTSAYGSAIAAMLGELGNSSSCKI